MDNNKIIHVHFKQPYEGESDLYFGCMSAIYDNLPADAVGIKYIVVLATQKCLIGFHHFRLINEYRHDKAEALRVPAVKYE